MSNTISVSITPSNGSSGSPVRGNSGNSAAAQIKAIHKQIEQLTKKLLELKDSDLPPDDLRKEIKQISDQISALWAQIAQIQAKEAEKAAEKAKEQDNNSASTPAADGINRPTDQNQMDVYI